MPEQHQFNTGRSCLASMNSSIEMSSALTVDIANMGLVLVSTLHAKAPSTNTLIKFKQVSS